MTLDFDTAIRVLQLAAQAAIPLTVYLAGRRIAKAQYSKSAQDGWNEFNKLVLASAENLRVAREHLCPPHFAQRSDDAMRKAYMGFVLLNAMSAFHLGRRHNLIDTPHTEATMRELLAPLLADCDIYALSQSRGYHPSFREFCRKVRPNDSREGREKAKA